MSSKGSPILTVRVSRSTLAQIDDSIDRKLYAGRSEPIGRSGWLAIAIREKLAKEERSRKSYRRTRRVRGPKPAKGSAA